MAEDITFVPLHRIDRSETFSLWVQHLTSQELETLLLEPPHRHDLHEIFLVTNGESQQIIDEQKYNFSVNTLGLITKGQIHHVLTMSDFCIWAVFFDRDVLTDHLFSLSLSLFHFRAQNQFQLTSIERQLLENLFSAMVAVQDEKNDTYAQVNLLCQYLGAVLWHLERINHRHYKQTQKSQLEHYEACQVFLGLLETHYKQEHRVQFYAEHLQLSGRQLSDITKEVLGQRAKKIIEERLSLEAKRLIRYSKLNIQEIGYQLGFDDPAYFARFFKQHNDCSPLNFRHSAT